MKNNPRKVTLDKSLSDELNKRGLKNTGTLWVFGDQTYQKWWYKDGEMNYYEYTTKETK